jgi:hypothetical protein
MLQINCLMDISPSRRQSLTADVKQTQPGVNFISRNAKLKSDPLCTFRVSRQIYHINGADEQSLEGAKPNTIDYSPNTAFSPRRTSKSFKSKLARSLQLYVHKFSLVPQSFSAFKRGFAIMEKALEASCSRRKVNMRSEFLWETFLSSLLNLPFIASPYKAHKKLY